MSMEAHSTKTKLKASKAWGRLIIYEGFRKFLFYFENIPKFHSNNLPPHRVPASPYTECAVPPPLLLTRAPHLTPPPESAFVVTCKHPHFSLAAQSRSLAYPNKEKPNVSCACLPSRKAGMQGKYCFFIL